jgi:hypothetical protein
MEKLQLKMCVQRFLVAFSLLLIEVVLTSPTQKQTAVNAQMPINSIATIISDMQPPHEGQPQGVPGAYDWSKGPRIGMGNQPRPNFNAMIAWGQLYEAVEGNSAINTRVQIRDLRAYLLDRRDRKWHLLQSCQRVEGAAYRADYKGNSSKPADIRKEPDGSISVQVDRNYNFHFWCPMRVKIDPNRILGMFTTAQARLTVENPQKTDDRKQARYLLSIAGDYWLNVAAPWDNFKTNGDIAIGKFKYVKPQWQAFNMITLSPEQIRRDPPPLQ